MKRAHISEGHQGQHPNAVSGAVRVTAASTPVTQGKSVARTHDAHQGVLVMDSPPYQPPLRCLKEKADGSICQNTVNEEGARCFGHTTGVGGPRE